MQEQRPRRRITKYAYAKINLYLDILSKREDGFHDLLTVMHSLAMHDIVSVETFPCPQTEISLRVFGARLPCDEHNLAHRAATLYLETVGRRARVHLNIRKNLPIAAGMAGGSSDAAATLRALNELYRYPLDEKTMLALGAVLGSDVPYCMVGGTQICRGRGEKMTPIVCKNPLYAVVATGGRERVSTPRAFAATDAYYRDFDGSVPHGGEPDTLYAALQSGMLPDTPDCVYNAFEPVIFPSCPIAESLRAKMLSLGAYTAHMSGSGPSVFGLFRTMEEAKAAARIIGPGAHATMSVL